MEEGYAMPPYLLVAIVGFTIVLCMVELMAPPGRSPRDAHTWALAVGSASIVLTLILAPSNSVTLIASMVFIFLLAPTILVKQLILDQRQVTRPNREREPEVPR